MKKNVLILILLSLSMIMNAAVATVDGTKISVTGLTAGGLDAALTSVTTEQLATATELKLQGEINRIIVYRDRKHTNFLEVIRRN